MSRDEHMLLAVFLKYESFINIPACTFTHVLFINVLCMYSFGSHEGVNLQMITYNTHVILGSCYMVTVTVTISVLQTQVSLSLPFACLNNPRDSDCPTHTHKHMYIYAHTHINMDTQRYQTYVSIHRLTQTLSFPPSSNQLLHAAARCTWRMALYADRWL
jgi:hypothetical protein